MTGALGKKEARRTRVDDGSSARKKRKKKEERRVHKERLAGEQSKKKTSPPPAHAGRCPAPLARFVRTAEEVPAHRQVDRPRNTLHTSSSMKTLLTLMTGFEPAHPEGIRLAV